MITVKVDNAKIGVNAEALENYTTLRMARQASKDPLVVFDLLDKIVDGGADRIAEILDPENHDPNIEEYGAFVEKLFTEIGENKQAKNSSSS